MSLAERLGLAIFALTVGVLLALGLGVREAWRGAEERSFEAAFSQALLPLRDQLQSELGQLPELVAPLCQDDPLIQSALVGLTSDDLEARRLPISLIVPKLAHAHALDRLVVITSTGEILGSTTPGQVGARDPALLASMLKAGPDARLRGSGSELVLEASCRKHAREPSKLWVGVYAARARILQRTTAEWRTSRTENHTGINQISLFHDALTQHRNGFVDERQQQSILQIIRRGLAARGDPRQDGICERSRRLRAQDRLRLLQESRARASGL